MGFDSLALLRHYDSDSVDIAEEFYRPVLRNSVRYDRAVGYFSSSALRHCASELKHFVAAEGRIRLIVGVLVAPEDVAALKQQGHSQEESERSRIHALLVSSLDELERADFDSAVLFARLVASGVAELKFAVRERGIYHEKFGTFQDKDGLKIAFIGSVNETAAAMSQDINHESCSVFQSIEPALYVAYGVELERRFESLWNGHARHTKVYALDSESLDRIAELSKKHAPSSPDFPPSAREALPAYFELRPYQLDAIRAWQAQDLRGILAMATGTGKTLTAIEAVKRLKQAIPGAAVVITVPYQNLAVQWIEALREHGIEAIGVFDSYANWYEPVRNQFAAAKYSDSVVMAAVVCVNASFKDDRFQGLLGLLKDARQPEHLLVVDECHHFNSPEHVKKLPTHFSMRLGLSATPYNQFEEHCLESYFGKIAYEFTLSRAISEGFLTPYRYSFFTCLLDDDETSAYQELTRRIIKIAGGEDKLSPETLIKVQPLLLQRGRIVGAAKDKLTVLSRHLRKHGKTPYTLFYCGDGSVENDYGESTRQIERVTELLHSLGWRTSRITAAESLRTRETLLDQLRDQLIDAVVSIKVLDEGIDVPACRAAYLLASQSSDRQGIQRRGRVLRKASGKHQADLYDFVVVGGSAPSTAMTSLATREVRRAYQFSRDSVNKYELFQQLGELQESIGLKRGDPDAEG